MFFCHPSTVITRLWCWAQYFSLYEYFFFIAAYSWKCSKKQKNRWKTLDCEIGWMNRHCWHEYLWRDYISDICNAFVYYFKNIFFNFSNEILMSVNKFLIKDFFLLVQSSPSSLFEVSFKSQDSLLISMSFINSCTAVKKKYELGRIIARKKSVLIYSTHNHGWCCCFSYTVYIYVVINLMIMMKIDIRVDVCCALMSNSKKLSLVPAFLAKLCIKTHHHRHLHYRYQKRETQHFLINFFIKNVISIRSERLSWFENVILVIKNLKGDLNGFNTLFMFGESDLNILFAAAIFRSQKIFFTCKIILEFSCL